MELLESDGQLTFATAHGALIVITHGRDLGSSFDLARQHIAMLHARHRAPVGVLYVVAHDEGPPERYKERSQELLAHVRSQLSAVSVVIMSKGFVAAVYRSVGTVVAAMTGKRDFVAFHGSVSDAVDWLAMRLPPGAAPGRLGAAVETLVRTHAKR
ncbi:MAG: hypothetical protein CMN30_22390 [Sandaracinus sp.]|nr:hypothetical protein [Sandaracinus sp.]|tara:strand:+ start:3988 stop:4455 length:468 start_codon:yes stop_codon:yes gene_type:complete